MDLISQRMSNFGDRNAVAEANVKQWVTYRYRPKVLKLTNTHVLLQNPIPAGKNHVV